MTYQLRAAEIKRLRSLPGHAAGLFITDRCPVGCAHCSVDSRPDSSTISDFGLFKSLVEGLATAPILEIVGITGGEPFVERKGLELAIPILKDGGKKVVLYTSGIWAKSKCAPWIRRVLARTETLFLSTDQFHRGPVDSKTFISAARAAAEAGCWIVIQAIHSDEALEQVSQLLLSAFGRNHSEYAETQFSQPLAYGRGSSVFPAAIPKVGSQFGSCDFLASPMIRYDGRATACCNEGVIMGHGSARLAKKCNTTLDLHSAMASFRTDPLLTVLSSLGMKALAMHPQFEEMGQTEYRSICEACWAMNNKAMNLRGDSDPLLSAMALLGTRSA